MVRAHNLRVMLWSWWSAINLSTRQTLIYAHSSRNQSWPTCRHPTFRHPTSRHSIFNTQSIRLSQIQLSDPYLCTLITQSFMLRVRKGTQDPIPPTRLCLKPIWYDWSTSSSNHHFTILMTQCWITSIKHPPCSCACFNRLIKSNKIIISWIMILLTTQCWITSN